MIAGALFQAQPSPRAALRALRPDEKRLLRHIHFRCQGDRRLCCEKVRGIADHFGWSVRKARTALSRLRCLGLTRKAKKRIRWAERGLTALGRQVMQLLQGIYVPEPPEPTPVPTPSYPVPTIDFAAHKGKGNQKKNREPNPQILNPSKTAHPLSEGTAFAAYVPKRASKLVWTALAEWISPEESRSTARLVMADREFGVLENRMRIAAMSPTGSTCMIQARETDPSRWVALSIQDAVRCRADFGTIESAIAYTRAVMLRALKERRLPGQRRADHVKPYHQQRSEEQLALLRECVTRSDGPQS